MQSSKPLNPSTEDDDEEETDILSESENESSANKSFELVESPRKSVIVRTVLSLIGLTNNGVSDNCKSKLSVLFLLSS